jgi:hypothetical protein
MGGGDRFIGGIILRVRVFIYSICVSGCINIFVYENFFTVVVRCHCCFNGIVNFIVVLIDDVVDYARIHVLFNFLYGGRGVV